MPTSRSPSHEANIVVCATDYSCSLGSRSVENIPGPCLAFQHLYLGPLEVLHLDEMDGCKDA